MGRGSSGLSGGSGGGGGAAKPTTTPSGITYEDFMGKSEGERYTIMADIINDSSIRVPSYLDDSDTSKVMYALGMSQKPAVVSDSQLDSMPGHEAFRTVYEAGSMPPPSSQDVVDQIRSGDFTQMSGRGGSAHGRALYFARDDFSESASYGLFERNPRVMRTKISPTAKIVSESTLTRRMRADSSFSSTHGSYSADSYALYAISHGIDGWHDRGSGYTMIINRGCLTASSTTKSIYQSGTQRMARSWASAPDAN